MAKSLVRQCMIGLLATAVPTALDAQTSSRVAVSMHSGGEREAQGREQVVRLLESYDLDRWIFTDSVVIQTRARPHSHPVLTLNTKYLDDDERQLTTFLHEQLHWFAVGEDEAVDHAIEELRDAYVDLPVGGPEGARSEHSGYLHLIVCLLELDALAAVIGEERAREILATQDHYTWIYRTVLRDTESILAVLTGAGIELP